MDRSQAQENISQLLNIEMLLGRLTKPLPNHPAGSVARVLPLGALEAASAGSQAARSWPRDVLSTDFGQRLGSRLAPAPDSRRISLIEHIDTRWLGHRAADAGTQARLAKLDEMLDLLTADVLAARDRLLMLNPGRRKLIEHRLECIARKVARARGERLNRSLSLPEVLKESYRDAATGQLAAPAAPKLSIAAWRGFVTEVAIYNLLQLFFLKSLDVFGWRQFDDGDLGRMNFAAHTFLSQRGNGFAHDRHCWNFVRTNLYSWYVPSRQTVEALARASSELAAAQFAWSDLDLENWVAGFAGTRRAGHLDFTADSRMARLVVDLLERGLGTPLTTSFQGRPVCRKFFVPALELGGVTLQLLERLLRDIRRASYTDPDGGVTDESSQLHRALWACETESFEVFWTEVLALLKTLRNARSGSDYSAPACLFRIPHVAHIVNGLGLELHDLEQLPLGGAEVSRAHQGSAGQIQQLENFDAAVVTDHPDRQKSASWMKALAQQLPYWRTLVGAGTNLNWGELHLHLALTKLREGGTCIYLSHRALPEGGDGERLRRLILNLGTLEYFVELKQDGAQNDGELAYRYLYVFRRVSKKLDRDLSHPRFGQLTQGPGESDAMIDLARFEESSCSQAEIAERGWDHIFVRGAAPLIRHLNHKFPKLFQIASVAAAPEAVASAGPSAGKGAQPAGLFAAKGQETKALEVVPDGAGGFRFQPACTAQPSREGSGPLIFPHNPLDLPWIQSLLNSAPAQFWVRHQLMATAGGAPAKAPRLHELRSCPVVDLSHTPSDLVQEALDWIGDAKPDAAALRSWAGDANTALPERHARYVALARHRASLERIVARYRPLFSGPSLEELNPESITQFYPCALLCGLSQTPDLRVQYVDRARSTLSPENWTLDESHSVLRETPGGKPAAFLVIRTRQGPSIQLLAPAAIRDYLAAQVQGLRGRTWGEALSLIRVPRDIALFTAQTREIIRVVSETAAAVQVAQRTLEDLALDLFEISADVRQFLPH